MSNKERFEELGKISRKFLEDLNKIGFSVVSGNGENSLRLEIYNK